MTMTRSGLFGYCELKLRSTGFPDMGLLVFHGQITVTEGVKWLSPGSRYMTQSTMRDRMKGAGKRL